MIYDTGLIWGYYNRSIGVITWTDTMMIKNTGSLVFFAYNYISIIRKSKDYVYGIWVYKALGIWKGYYRVKKSLVSYVKPGTEARNNKYMKYLQTCIPTLILKCEPKSGLSCRRQVVHPRPQTPQGESVAKPETPLLIILSIACK